VVYYIMLAKNASGADLITEALKSDVPWVAELSAPVALVAHSYGWDLGEEIGDVFHELVLKQPHVDGFRWEAIRQRDDDPRCGTFGKLYLRWMKDQPPDDTELNQRLTETYRDAWLAGEPLEQAFVLEFLFFPLRPDAADLIVDGLKSHERRVINSAVKAADLYMDKGVDLGPHIRAVLNDLRERVPERLGQIDWMLRRLDENEDTSTA
jgi:hypothetical protein